MNVKLLKKVKNQIRKNWKHFDMESFDSFTECGTTHCIGGWAVYFKYLNKAQPLSYDHPHACLALDITSVEGQRLFFCTNWPVEFQGEATNIWQPTKQQVLDRIDHFIATEGRE